MDKFTAWIKKVRKQIMDLFGAVSGKDESGSNTNKPTPNQKPSLGSAEGANAFVHPASITCEMTMDGLERGKVFFHTGDRSSWDKFQGDLTGEVWCGVFRNGSWQCAKFDHVRINCTMRELKHMYSENEYGEPYGDWKQIGGPRPGEKVCFFVIDYPHQQRTEAIFGVLP